jgi:Alpha-lytic protease prodomain
VVGRPKGDDKGEVDMRLMVAVGVLTILIGCGSSTNLSAGGGQHAMSTSPNSNATSFATTQTPGSSAGQPAELTTAVEALRDQAQRQFPDTFGGVYWQGDRVKLAFTRDAEAHRDQVVRDFPRPELVDAVTVKFSLAELQAVADRITAESEELVRQGANLSTWGVDPTANRVRVGIEQPTPAVIENLQRRYGSEILDIVNQPLPRAVSGEAGH